jgi:hypothetical protein
LPTAAWNCRGEAQIRTDSGRFCPYHGQWQAVPRLPTEGPSTLARLELAPDPDSSPVIRPMRGGVPPHRIQTGKFQAVCGSLPSGLA